MEKRFVFRSMERTEALENYCDQQLAKIEKLLENENEPIYINVVLEPSKIHAHHFVEVRVKTPVYEEVSTYEGPKFYDVVDRVIDTLYRNLLDARKKKTEQRRASGRHDEVKKQK